jgi:hypothetical protein
MKFGRRRIHWQDGGHILSLRTIALALTEIGRLQRAGVMPTLDGRVVHGLSDDECIALLKSNYTN